MLTVPSYDLCVCVCVRLHVCAHAFVYLQCHEKMTAIMKTEEGMGIEYDEDIVCDVCRSVSVYLSGVLYFLYFAGVHIIQHVLKYWLSALMCRAVSRIQKVCLDIFRHAYNLCRESKHCLFSSP